MLAAEMLLKTMMAASADRNASILPEAAIVRLREAAQRYAEHLEGPRFQIGQLVTPMKDGDLKGAGDPHLVVETRRGEPDFGAGAPGTSDFGGRWDMRVLCFSGETLSAYWTESWAFDLWTAACAGPA